MNLKKIMPSYLLYLINRLRIRKKSRNDHNAIHKHRDSVKEFKKALCQFSYVYSGYAGTYIDGYLNKSVKPVKVLQPVLKENDPILLCVVKNDLEKIKLQVDHHRKIGIKHFVYIDNISRDGTFEWLKEQNDVSLFIVDEAYDPIKQRAWLRQATDVLGYDKWYLVLDADELFIYPGIETRNIDRYIDFLENSKIDSALSPMIDMYSKDKLFEDYASIQDAYCYFDTDTYKMRKHYSRYDIYGGPRMRLFSTENLLTKYALTKFSKDMLLDTHQNYPYKHNFETKGAVSFLLHYKFLHTDDKKFREHAVSGLYFNGSKAYKKYVEVFEENQSLSFYNEGSRKLNDSMDLLKINIIDKAFFKKFLAE